MATDESDKVGYGQPPKATRFKPGQSGNRKGRGQKNAQARAQHSVQSVTADIMDELQETITIAENGRERKVTKQKAFVAALVALAIKGDVRAINAVVAFARHAVTGPHEWAPDDDAGLEDLQILESFVERERKRRERLEVAPEAIAEGIQCQKEIEKDEEDL
jgi:Family of unknown function (DUF5681)